MLNGVSLIVAAYILVNLLPPPYVWLAYLITTLLCLSLELWFFRSLKKSDSEQENAELLYLSLKPDEAVEAIRKVSKDAVCTVAGRVVPDGLYCLKQKGKG